MKARFMFEHPDDIEATLKVTMPVRQWVELRDQLASAYPSWQLSAAITDLIIQARKVLYAKEDADE